MRMSPSSSSSTLSLLLLVSSSLCVTSSDNAERLIRRLNAEETEPTKNPTAAPINADCFVSLAGDEAPIVNPSTVSMGTINLGTAVSDIDLESGDSVLDGDNAKAWCVSHFGANSKPVTPTNLNTWNAVINICEALGNGNACYLGLYREDYNGDQTQCESWRGEDATFTSSSDNLKTGYGGNWSNNQPSCPWLASSHSRYLASPTRHCLEYRTSSNKMRVGDCTGDLHIVCEYDGTCSP